MARPELAGWRGLGTAEAAKALNYEVIGYFEVMCRPLSDGAYDRGRYICSAHVRSLHVGLGSIDSDFEESQGPIL